MKNLKTWFIILCLGIITSACYRHRVTIVTTENNNVKTKIEYSGRIIFNDERTGVLNLSRNGYFKYQRNDEKINVETDRNGNIVYEVNNAGESAVLNDEGKHLLAEAIRAIAREQAKHRGKMRGL